MRQWRWVKSAVALALLACLASPVRADRTPSRRAEGQKSTGSRVDITVPYLTNGTSAFGAYTVAPRVYAAPVVDDPAKPGTRPTFNLPFFGGRMGFSGTANGAVPKPALLPSDGRCCQPIISPARLTAIAQSPSAGVSCGMKASPGRGRLRSRSSRGSISSSLAASFMFDSTAQICWGLPKPRNAVEGTVCESTLRATIRTFGTRYGPFDV